MADSRAKGKAGEREAAKLFIGAMRQVESYCGIDCSDDAALSSKVERNLQQSINGGHDLNGIPIYAVEVKRVEKPQLNQYWQQACVQAGIAKLEPLLVYKMNRQDWRVRYCAKHNSGRTILADSNLMDWLAEFQVEYYQIIKDAL